jgi:hypothetical protein
VTSKGGGGGGVAREGGAGAVRGWGGARLGLGAEVGVERKGKGSAEVYIVFGKIQGARRAVSRARCEAGAAQTTTQ